VTVVETHDGIRRAPLPNGGSAATLVPSQVYPLAKDIKRRAQAAAAVAATHAGPVDVEARFPAEAMSAIRAQRLLGILVPVEFGGEGASFSEMVNVCYMLGCACGSVAMIYAMHQIMVACLVRHAGTSAWHNQLLRRLCD